MKIIKSIRWITLDGKKTWQQDISQHEYSIVIDNVEHALTKEHLEALSSMITTILPAPIGYIEGEHKFIDLVTVSDEGLLRSVENKKNG